VPNRLAVSTSPYLLQHQDNPVDWWPWGEEAFAEARRLDRPVLLSVGYAACHWCHVMAHESFEDQVTAEAMNASFVCVKVDREERPDVDAVYMSATQALTGHGGWPMTVFLTPQGRPFYAGTYFPPRPTQGMPSFRQVLTAISQAWQEQREELLASGGRISAALADRGLPVASGPVREGELAELVEAAVTTLADQEDASHGGFGGAPKFPPSMVLEFLLRHAATTATETATARTARDLAARTLAAMARGGLYDQVAGGFARYAVDREWVVPHFEKMLYDNALLARVYLHWWRLTGEPTGARIAVETCDWMLAGLGTPEGGLASSLDADTPVRDGVGVEHGVEGYTYVWTPGQLTEVLGRDDGRWAADLLRVTADGTFEHGASTAQLARDVWADPGDAARWSSLRDRLRQARGRRPQPGRDDKVVAAWNGLAIAALAETGALLDRPDLVAVAERVADLLVAVHLVAEEPGARPHLRRVSRGGVAGDPAGVLEDYGDVAEGLLTLHSVTGDPTWLEVAGVLLDTVLAHFTDGGGFFDTGDDATDSALLNVARPQDPTDNAYPSGVSAVAGALLSYAALTGSQRHRDAAVAALGAARQHAAAAPRAFGWALAVAEGLLDGPREVAVIGPDGDPLRAELHRTALAGTAPGLVVAVGEPDQPGGAPLLAGRSLLGGAAAAYVCHRFTCQAPTSSVTGLKESVGAFH
jgi:uncharacterized protein YyaL (SSP411 family)